MALTTIPSELSSVSGISDSSSSTAITIDSSQNVTFAGNITTGSNTISGVLSSVTGSIGSAATATTQAASDNSTKLATTAYVTTALANLVDSAPGTLNTLNELAAALGDDANFSTTVTNSIATKLPLAGGTMTGNIAHAGTFTIDVGGNLVLDADGGDILLHDGGTLIGQFALNNTGNFDIYSAVSDADIRIRGNDGGSTVTALTFDISDGGRALFGSSVALLSDTTQLQLGAGNDFQIGYDGTDAYLRNHSGGQIIQRARTGFLFQANATGSGADDAIRAAQNGAVTLYYDGSAKIATTSAGIGVTGRITATSNHSQLTLTDSDDSKFALVSYSSGKYIVRNNSTNTSENQFTLTEDGKFGIGTTSPAQLLHVSGGASASTNVRFGQTFDTSVEIGPVTATASGQIKFLNASGTSKVSMGFRDSGSGSDGAFRIRRGATLDSSGALFNFGTSGQIELLKSSVSGAHTDSFAALYVQDTEARLQLMSANTGDEASSVLLSNVNKHWGIVNHGPDQSNRFAIGYHESSSSGTDIANALSDAVTITSSGLDVGIGRVPASGFRLDVNDSNSGTANLLRLRNSSTGASATAKMLFSLNRTGSSIDFEAGSIEVRKEQSWTTTPSTIDSHMRFMTVDNESVTEKVRIHSNGVVSIPNGIELASGLDATAANTLDDYEEGTFSPTLTGSGNAGTASYTYRTGWYRKVGTLVVVNLIVSASISGASGNLQIENFPFASNAESIGSFQANQLATSVPSGVMQYAPIMQNGHSKVLFRGTKSDGTGHDTLAVQNLTYLRVTISYKTS